MRIFRLEASTRYYASLRLATDEEPDLLALDLTGSSRIRDWNPPLTFVYRGDDPKSRLPISDFPSFTGDPVFSARAADALDDILKPRGELLRIPCVDGEYYAYNVTHFVDCFDTDRSVIERYPKSGRIVKIRKFVFDERPLAGDYIFKVPELKGKYVFVTDLFVRRSETAGLTGFVFKEC